jgi:hypothetical protein
MSISSRQIQVIFQTVDPDGVTFTYPIKFHCLVESMQVRGYTEFTKTKAGC